VQGASRPDTVLQAGEESIRIRSDEDSLRRVKGASVKTLAAFLLCWIAPLTMPAYGNTPRAQDQKPAKPVPAPAAAAPAQEASGKSASSIDPAKEAAIRNMFEVLGMRKMMQDVIANMSSSMKPMLMSSLPPGDYREKLADLFFKRFQSKVRVEQLLDIAVPIYDKYFSKEEVEGLTRFYQTTLGKKALSVLPQSLMEMQTASMKLGEKLGAEAMAEVLEEHPDLKKALEDAAASPKG
jgi:uncharacterized protein